jgi:hypothetical protein
MRITIPLVAPDKNAGRLRVAVVPRLVPALGFGLAAAGAGIGALLVRQAFLAMRNAEMAGIGAVARGMAEANLPVLGGLYLAIVVGGAGLLILIVRMFVETKTSAPSVWFLLIAGTLGIVPVALFWWAESLIIGALDPGSGGIVTAANTLTILLPAIMFAAPVVLLLLLTISVWPVHSMVRPKWGPVAVLLMIEVALIAMAVALQMRTSWLFQVSQAERLLP